MKVAWFGSAVIAIVIAFVVVVCSESSPLEPSDGPPGRAEVPAGEEEPGRTEVASSCGQPERTPIPLEREVKAAEGARSKAGSPERAEEHRREYGDGDGWLRRGYRDLFRGYPRDLPKEKAATVTDEFEAEAERRLESVAWVRIEASEAEAFVGRKLSIGRGELAVLLRGVAWEYTVGSSRESDKLRVRRKDGVVVVLQIGSRDCETHPRIVRRAAVAVLSGEPTDVYPDGMVSFFESVPPPR